MGDQRGVLDCINCGEAFCTTTEVPTGGHTHAHVFVARCGEGEQNSIYSMCKQCATGPEHLSKRAEYERACRARALTARETAAAAGAGAGGGGEGAHARTTVFTPPSAAGARFVSGLRGAPHTLLGDSEAAVAAGQKARDRNLTIGGTFKCGGLPDGLNIQFDRAETHTNMSDLALLTGRDDTGIATVMEAGLDAERAIQGARRTVKAVVRDAVFSHGFLVKIGKDIGAHTGRIAGRIHQSSHLPPSNVTCHVPTRQPTKCSRRNAAAPTQPP